MFEGNSKYITKISVASQMLNAKKLITILTGCIPVLFSIFTISTNQYGLEIKSKNEWQGQSFLLNLSVLIKFLVSSA